MRILSVAMAVLAIPAFCMAQPLVTDSITISQVKFMKMDEEQTLLANPVRQYKPGETVYFQITAAGRVTTGILLAEFWLGETYLTEVALNLAEAGLDQTDPAMNQTMVNFRFHQKKPFPPGEDYRVDLYFDGNYISTYFFTILPYSDSIPSRLHFVTLAKNRTEDYQPVGVGKLFTAKDRVHIGGSADTGKGSLLAVRFFINGKLDEMSVYSLTIMENRENNAFSFSYLPKDGWPAGEHAVELTLDDMRPVRLLFQVR